MAFDVERPHEFVGYGPTRLILHRVQHGLDRQARSGGRATDDGQEPFPGPEWGACPIRADEAEQPMLNRVPF
jgi:hypothetical protein